MDTKHQTYAGAASRSIFKTDAEAPPEVSTLEDGVVRFLTTKEITIDLSDISMISVCHTLGGSNHKLNNRTPPQPRVIIRFTNRKAKVNMLKMGKNLKGTNVYINEHLTARQAELAKTARLLRKQNSVHMDEKLRSVYQTKWLIRQCKTTLYKM